MNSPKVAKKDSVINSDSRIKTIKSQPPLLKTINRAFVEPLKTNHKNQLNHIKYSLNKNNNQKQYDVDAFSYSLNHLNYHAQEGLETNICFRKLIYDNKLKQNQIQELKILYDQLAEECKNVKEQNEKLVNFLKQNLHTKLDGSRQFQNATVTAHKSSDIKRSLSLAKFQKSSHFHQQKNAKLQYTVDELIKKVAEQWSKLIKKTKETKNMEDILGNQYESEFLQQMHHLTENQKIEIQKLTQQNVKLSNQLVKQKEKFESYKKKIEQHEHKKIAELLQQNKKFHEEIQDLKKCLEVHDQALLNIINIAQKPSFLKDS